MSEPIVPEVRIEREQAADLPEARVVRGLPKKARPARGGGADSENWGDELAGLIPLLLILLIVVLAFISAMA